MTLINFLSPHENLKYLNLDSNQIWKIDLENTENLEYLNLKNNQVRRLNLNDHKKINDLELDKKIFVKSNNEHHKSLFKKLGIKFRQDSEDIIKIKKLLFCENPMFFKENKSKLSDFSYKINDLGKDKKEFVIKMIGNNPILEFEEAISLYEYFNNNLIE